MGFLFGRQSPTNKPDYTGLQIQTAVNTLPIPIIFGTAHCSVNLIYMNDFTAVIAKSSSSGKGGGKGLLSGGKSGNAQYNYYATLVLAIGEGPMPNQPIVVFEDQGIYNIDGLPGGQTPSYYPGYRGQTPFPGIAEEHPEDARSYTETAYIASGNWLLDSSATVPQFSLLQQGFYQGSCPLNRANYTIANQNAPASPAEQVVAVNLDMDADPATVIFAFLTDAQWGVLGFTPSNLPFLNSVMFQYPEFSSAVTVNTFIDPGMFSTINAGNPSVGDSAFQTYCQAVGFGFSVVLDSTEQASSILDRWTKILSTAVVWTGATLKFIPYWDTFVGNNPQFDSGNEAGIPMKYFRPNTTPLFSLTDDDFVQTKDQDPVTYERIDTADVYNTVRLSYKDRQNLWNDNVVEAKDENDIELNGLRVDSMNSASEFSNSLFAGNAAQAIVQRNTSVRVRYTFKLSWEYSILDPMDIVQITDSKLGLANLPVRIVSIEEDEKLELTIVAEEFPVGAASTVLYPQQPSGGANVFNTNAPVHLVNQPFIFEPTAQQLAAQGGGNPSIAIGLSAGVTLNVGPSDSNFGGADVYLSNDGVTYRLSGRFNGVSTMGYTTANWPSSGSVPDTTNDLFVNLTESGGELVTVTAAQAQAGVSLCAVFNGSALELVAYVTATLTSANNYQLHTLYRGLYGTTPITASSGSQFLFLGNGAFFEAQLPPDLVGVSLFLKFTAFNAFNTTEQDLADVAVYNYTPTGAGTASVTSAVPAGSVVGKPGVGATLQLYTFSHRTVLPAGLTGSQGTAATAATSTATFNIQKNGSNVGTMVFAASGTVATFAMATSTTFNIGDVLGMIAPTPQDGTLANVSWTLVGSIT